jgi:hypothetical protein
MFMGLGVAIGQNVAAQSGGGGTWTPATAATPAKAYYDVSDISTLFQDTAGTTPVTANGQTVKLIKDKSGNGIDIAAQNGVGWVYTAGAKPFVTINGATENFQSATFTPVWADTNGQITCGMAINFSGSGATQIVLAGTNTYGNLLENNAGTSSCEVISTTGTPLVTDAGPAITAGTGVAMTSIIKVSTSNTVEMFVNGASNGATTFVGSPANAGDKIAVGGFSSAGNMSALAIFPTALGSTDHASFVSWLQARI